MKPTVCDSIKKSIQPSGTESKLWFKQISESLFKSSSFENRVKHNDTMKLPGGGLKHSKSVESAHERKISTHVHSVTGLPPGTDPRLTWQKLMQERHKNKVLLLEIGRLTKSLKDKSEEIESKKKVIEKLKDEKNCIEANRDIMTEDAADIENLLNANLGDVSLTDLLSMTGANFPAELIDLDLTELDQLDMMENLTCKVEAEPEQVQIPNREARDGIKSGFVKTEVIEGVIVNHLMTKGSLKEDSISKNNVKQEVSPIKMIKKDDKYQVARMRKHQTSNQLSSSENKKIKFNIISSEISEVQNSLTCPTCKKKFAIGNQWKLTRHMLLVHSINLCYSCQYCGEKFPCLSILNAHIMAHKLSHPFQCAQCGYRLGQIREFVKHVKSAHEVTSISRALRMMVMTKD